MATGALADEIRHKLGELSPAERKVARVLLAGYPAAGFETVAVLAERAAVSAPTVIRFANRLGYRGFPDFQAALREELDARNASPLSLYETAGFSRPGTEADGEDPDSALLRHGSQIDRQGQHGVGPPRLHPHERHTEQHPGHRRADHSR